MLAILVFLIAFALDGMNVATAQTRGVVQTRELTDFWGEPVGCRAINYKISLPKQAVVFVRPDGSSPDQRVMRLIDKLIEPISTWTAETLCSVITDGNELLAKEGIAGTITIPEQDFSVGTLRFTVTTMRIVEVLVDGDVGPYSSMVKQKLALITAMNPLNKKAMMRILNGLNALPDFSIRMMLTKASAVPGDVIATVRTNYTGRERITYIVESQGAATKAPPPNSTASAAVVKSAPSGKRIALLIGNSSYSKELGVLPNATHDIELIGKRLTELGFDVEKVENGNRQVMSDAIGRLRTRIKRSGRDTVGLFYYSEHGTQVDGSSYLVPVMESMDDLDLVVERAIDAQYVMATLDSAGNSFNIVILDACRKAPGTRGPIGNSDGIGPLFTKDGTFIAYSTAMNSAAADGTGEFSPYADALAAEMSSQNVGIEEVFKRVRKRVRAATKAHQTPWESTSFSGDFFFNP